MVPVTTSKGSNCCHANHGTLMLEVKALSLVLVVGHT